MNSELKQKIDQYSDFPWESLLRKDLGRHSLEEVEDSFVKIKSYFDTILQFQPTNKLPEQYLQVLLSQLNALSEFAMQVQKQFQNVSERPDWVRKVKQFEYSSWESLKPIIEYIQFLHPNQKKEDPKIEAEITKAEKLVHDATLKLNQVSEFETKLKSEFDKISKHSSQLSVVVDEIAQNQEKYKKAQEVAENWIKTEGKATAAAIQDKSQIFNDKAKKEHTGSRVWVWLIGVLLFAAGAIASAGLLIWKLNGSGEGLSVGAALLRISVVGMFFSLAYLCYQQFSIQRRLYEMYRFKGIALSTMENLIKSFTEPGDRQLIVEKAIDIVFTEPSFKEDKVAHQRVIDELVDVIKKKI